MTKIKNPLTLVIQAGQEGGSTSSNIQITKYQNGKITGTGLGENTGTVYILDRDTHTYNSLSVSNWSNTEIELSTAIDLDSIEGTTCIFARTSDNVNTNKLMIHGTNEPTGYGVVYLQEDELNPTTIRKVYFTSSSDLAGLCGVNNYWYYSRTTSAGENWDMKNVVGFQFGASCTSYTPGANFLGNMLKFNQPVYFKNGITLSANYIMRYDYSFDCPIEFGNQTRVGNYFLYYCYGFNQPLDLSKFTLVSFTYFMYYCRSFNSELKLPTTAGSSTTLGAYFMNYCYAFNQPLNIPTNIKSISNYFLRYCQAFNQPLKLPSVLTSIGSYFLQYCYAFNQPLNFPTGVSASGNYFLSNCYGFNQPITFAKATITVGTYFMQNCYAYNQPSDFISRITSIGTYFMYYCYSFNQPISINSGITSIPGYFMNSCFCLSQHIDLKNVTTTSTYFLTATPNLRSINVRNSAVPTDNYALTSGNSLYCPAYQSGVKVYGTNRQAWLDALPKVTTTAPGYRNLIDGGE